RLGYMKKRGVEIHHLTNQLSTLAGHLTKRHSAPPQRFYDVVTCHPPYFETKHVTQHNENEHLTMARHEVCCTLSQVIEACKLYVKPGGKVSLVHRPERLVDILHYFRLYRLEPKRLQFDYRKQVKEANRLIIEETREGKSGLKVLDPLYIYDEFDSYTEEVRRIIYGE